MTADAENRDVSELLAKYDRIESLRAGTWPANKASVLSSLAAAGITHVVVTFDGCGDSGQVESVETKTGDTQTDLPRITVAWQTVDGETEAYVTGEIALDEAIETLVYDGLRQTHCGWENNAGAFGEVIFDAAVGTVTLDYNERFESSEYTQHVL